MRIVKYVIGKSGIPILFRTNILHCEVITNALSAGYAIVDYDVSTDQFRVKCYGGSESLKINIDIKDCLIIQNYLNKLLCNSDSFSSSELDGLLSSNRVVKNNNK